jgi:microcin C transport system substrate-binding protein
MRSILAAMLLSTWPVLDIDYGHGTSYLEPLKYPTDFTHFSYANPEAPKGGMVRFPELGTFDSFNNILDKGRVPLGMSFTGINNLIYDRLLESAIDETASFYGRLAEEVWVSDDYKQMAFKLRPNAQWHDGSPLTVDDVIFTFETFQQHGSAGIRTALLELDRIERISEREVLFTVNPDAAGNPVLPFAIGGFPILPKHYWADRDITKTTVEPPTGSGPYRLADYDLGRYLTFDRVDDYWGADVPVNKGRYNFDHVKYDYFRDEAIMLEALKGDVIDVRHETVSKAWANEYEFPAVKAGYFKKELVDLNRPWGMWWPAIWNLDRDKFQDIRVREALWLLNDFLWENRVILFGFYKQANSFFYNSPMAQGGLPSDDELKLLEPWRGQIPERVFTHEWKQPYSTGIGYNRDNVKRALALFKEAGWEVRDSEMVNAVTGEPFNIDFIFVSPMLLRSKMPYISTLERVGIRTTARSPEVSNWLFRMRTGRFDGGADNYIPSNTPGPELRNRFSSAAAEEEYGQNWTRIRNPAVDGMIEQVLAARSQRDFYAATRALDRILLWNFYYIPGMAQPGFRLVYWDKFGQPSRAHLQRAAWLDTWWWDDEKAQRVRQGMAELTGSR